MLVLSVIHYVHSLFETQENKESSGKFTINIKFSHFIMNIFNTHIYLLGHTLVTIDGP